MARTDSSAIKDVQRTYLPAAGRDWALPFYDPFVKLVGGEKTRKTLLDQAALQPMHRVLDIGCGTGTLATLIKRRYPDATVVGLDPDPKALARARKKAERAGVSIQFDQGFADELPYPDTSFDRVFSSMMFHHLQPEHKEKTLREIKRVLAPGGSLHLLDFSEDEGHSHGLAHWFHSSDRMKDNSENRILTLMRQAGFISAKKVMEDSQLFGIMRTAYYQACV